MSREYDLYLKEHKDNVMRGFEWMKSNIPHVLGPEDGWGELEWQLLNAHDMSKNDPEEYNAYDAYLYGKNRSYQVMQDFNYAWLRHIHHNPHHWQYWVLINDNPEEGTLAMDIPYNYIIEMICDWWSFSWKKKELFEIFNWYNEHKDHMILSDKTRIDVENILNNMRRRVKEMKGITHE